MRHHTKDKGDVGVGFVIADLLSRGIQVALPLSEHLPFDCIAISEDGTMLRLSVKFRTARRSGTVRVARSSVWADRKGTHTRKHQRGDYDAFAIYSPTTGKCYYVRESEVEGEHISLRVTPSKNGQQSGCHPAELFVDPKRLFKPS